MKAQRMEGKFNMATNKTTTTVEDTKKSTETKAEAFARIANRRVNKALDSIAVLRSLSNKNNYEYTAEQADKIVKSLSDQVDKLRGDFARGGVVKNDSGFSL